MGVTAIDLLMREHDELHDLFGQLRDPQADRGHVWLEIVKRVTTHVAVERTFVYPLVKHGRLGSPRLAGDLRHDYKQMEHLLVLTERRKINSPDMPELVTDLLDVFDAHRDRCTTVLVPAMQHSIPTEELERLGAKMKGAENIIVSHPHPHLLATGPIYQWTTRIASKWDRVRDRTVRNR
jgi:hypothetical protein